ncbi:hypothetical protein BP5796_11560 [Coleophoma crateriformis]|uniref:Zn(2)-C6 fungal-type domain-containing protein n=1 Tax=Coleophoma crateriformis TaxID=565419 RepID=A0A3D8QIY0_9HELO|nr:hypothetical protein BP5796_11560 [Coleophoma crateriformis]
MSAASQERPRGGGAESKRQRASMPKTKTGCMTCRIRRVKCDEGKPACRRCELTGRLCDGYPSLFRVSSFSNATAPAASLAVTVRAPILPSMYQLRLHRSTQQTVSELAAQFTIKPAVGIIFSYESEARVTLGAVSEPEVRHALDSLNHLRDTFQQYGDFAFLTSQLGPRTLRSLQEYNMAVASLASRLSDANPKSVKLALICCQLFISIEAALSNYVSALQHFVRGLQIMHQNRIRPSLDKMGRFVASRAGYRDLPQLDLYILKLFLSPCPIQPLQISGTKMFDQQGQGSASTQGTIGIAFDHPTASQRVFAEQARIQLDSIALSISHLVDTISCLTSTAQATSILHERSRLLEQLYVWQTTFKDLYHALENEQWHPTARFCLGFTFLLHPVLRVITVLSIGASSMQESNVQQDFHEMTKIAEIIGESRRQAVAAQCT